MAMKPVELIERFGKTQRNGKTRFPCPRCGQDTMDENLVMNALSRRFDVYICSQCGTDEAMNDYFGCDDNLEDWSIVRSFMK